jgi:hypothetical protein
LPYSKLKTKMITNISRQLTTGTLALAGSVAALSFAGAAQAASMIIITGSATVPAWGTTNPTLIAGTATGVSMPSGQFAGVTPGDISSILPITLNGTGTGPNYTFMPVPSPIPNFVTITTGAGNVIVDITPTSSIGSFATMSGMDSATYTVAGTAVFDEPTGPDYVGVFNMTFMSSGSIYILNIQKTGVSMPVPEPSAILGILAVAGVGAFARRKS